MSISSTPYQVELSEQFDEDGNVVRVGNLTFVEGVLGTGAFGCVRLARRTLKPRTAESTPECSSGRKRRNQRYGRSASAPTDSFFFQSPPRERSNTSRMVGALELFPPRENANNKEQLVAVKILNKSILKRMRTMERDKETNRMQVKTAFEKVEREIALMKKFSHPNLVALYEAIDSPESNNLYMVIEYMPLGEIMTYQDDGTFRRNPPKAGQRQIEGVVNGHFTESSAALFFVDILHALGYLHQHHICHRDLKPENILYVLMNVYCILTSVTY